MKSGLGLTRSLDVVPLSCPRARYVSSQSLPRMIVEDGDTNFHDHPRYRSQASPSNAVSRHTLPTVNAPESHAEQEIDELRGQGPFPRPPLPHAPHCRFDRIKRIPTVLAL